MAETTTTSAKTDSLLSEIIAAASEWITISPQVKTLRAAGEIVEIMAPIKVECILSRRKTLVSNCKWNNCRLLREYFITPLHYRLSQFQGQNDEKTLPVDSPSRWLFMHTFFMTFLHGLSFLHSLWIIDEMGFARNRQMHRLHLLCTYT